MSTQSFERTFAKKNVRMYIDTPPSRFFYIQAFNKSAKMIVSADNSIAGVLLNKRSGIALEIPARRWTLYSTVDAATAKFYIGNDEITDNNVSFTGDVTVGDVTVDNTTANRVPVSFDVSSGFPVTYAKPTSAVGSVADGGSLPSVGAANVRKSLWLYNPGTADVNITAGSTLIATINAKGSLAADWDIPSTADYTVDGIVHYIDTYWVG